MYMYLAEKRKAQSKGENCARQWDTDMERVKLREARQRDHERERDRRFCNHINDDQAVNRKV
jgi:hypothetical protein